LSSGMKPRFGASAIIIELPRGVWEAVIRRLISCKQASIGFITFRTLDRTLEDKPNFLDYGERDEKINDQTP